MAFVIFLDFHSTKQGLAHWLILGHIALTKIKYIPIVICLLHSRFYCRHAMLLPTKGGALRDDTKNDCVGTPLGIYHST